jgi:glycosyltransferase involved in cell wall biosynthesis
MPATPKVLFVGHYREQSGWGNAAQDYILAMDRAGVDVVPRPIKLNNVQAKVHPRILALERNRSPQDCDVCIQNVLPHFMKYDGRFKKNIGICFTETTERGISDWHDHMELMDEIWAPNNDMPAQSNLNVPVYPIGVPCNPSKYHNEYPDIPQLSQETMGNYVFYYIGEFSRKKNITSILRAFHSEFDFDEPVSLVLKCNKFGVDHTQLAEEIAGNCTKVKENLKKYSDLNRYKKEITITQYLQEDQIMSLHNQFDCFVTTSFGEGWCVPAFDALSMGNMVLAPNFGGPTDYLNDRISVHKEPAFGMTETFPDIFTCKENWHRMDISALMKGMRKMFNQGKNSNKTTNAGIIDEYSYDNVGNLMKELLEGSV